jgi:hypothetical protein
MAGTTNARNAMSTHSFVTGAGRVIRSKAFVAAAVLVVAALALVAMLGHGSTTASRPPAKAHPTAAPRTPAPPRVLATNPLTGLAPVPAGPVVAVKIDDTVPGRPSLGVQKADVIYIEEAEGGLSRMVAVFASAKPQVEAVRSTRQSDPELLAPYGRIILVASGGDSGELAPLDHSRLHSSINDRGAVGFHRDLTRFAPYNLVADLATISSAIKADGVRNVGFNWAASDPRLARAAAAPHVNTLVGSTLVSFFWDAHAARYVRTADGRPLLTATGAQIAKPNVLVQYTQVTADHTDLDTAGNPAMYTHTIGSGRVELFRGGRHISGTWTRRSLNTPTVFRDVHGKPLLLAPGGTFVVLVRPGAPF